MPEQYASAAAVESAIRDASSLASKVDGAPNKDQLILREYFNRFLSRIFSDGESSEWVLKGGTGILARVPSTRSTMDIDLYREGFSLDEALKELRVLSSVDLDDHFRFEYVKHDSSLATDAQPYVDGCRVTFNIYLGVAPKGKLQVDLVTGSGHDRRSHGDRTSRRTVASSAEQQSIPHPPCGGSNGRQNLRHYDRV